MSAQTFLWRLAESPYGLPSSSIKQVLSQSITWRLTVRPGALPDRGSPAESPVPNGTLSAGIGPYSLFRRQSLVAESFRTAVGRDTAQGLVYGEITSLSREVGDRGIHCPRPLPLSCSGVLSVFGAPSFGEFPRRLRARLAALVPSWAGPPERSPFRRKQSPNPLQPETFVR
ncbi:hypothetical protein Srufu_075950 [Streptomyces libani subsp. rufus]|nr:hypothetical protein Srufu_075950 [Streptomyces libani subsp. rufus]